MYFSKDKFGDKNKYFLYILISPFANFLYFFPLGTRIDKAIVFLSFFKGAFNVTITVSFDGNFKRYFLSS